MAQGELDTYTKYMAWHRANLIHTLNVWHKGELDIDTKYMAQGELDTYTKYMAWHRANLIQTLNIWLGIGRT